MWVAFALQKLLTCFFSKNISVYAIFNNQNFTDTLTNDIVCFEQLDPGWYFAHAQADLHLCILHIFEGTFSLDVAHMAGNNTNSFEPAHGKKGTYHIGNQQRLRQACA